ncbi:MAG: hypothetical protein MK105_02020 [Crocinitomicaceae bacterium]|nr:hypothetical protein [Crocinitomicaceae bacterium]
MNKFFLVLTCAIVSISCYSQDLTSKADSLRNLGFVNEASEVYRKILLKDSTNGLILYNYACVLALNNQFDQAFEYLNKSTERDTSIRPLTDPDLYFLTNDPRWEDFALKEITKVESKFGKYQNLTLAKELWRMNMTDQAFYYQLDVAKIHTGYNSVVVDGLWELKRKLNHSNLERLIEIIDVNGWPLSSEVGGSAANAAFLIIQHANLEVQKKYLPIMKEAADKGEASWASLALLIDRVEMRQQRPQVYGSQIQRIEGEFVVYEIVDPEFVNQRREEVGLGPIEEYVQHWDITWTTAQKRK